MGYPSAEGEYGLLREDFLKFHQCERNIMLHLFTGGLGFIGACGLIYRCSNRSLGTLALVISIYAVYLVGTIPFELVLAVALLFGVVVVPVVKAFDLGLAWSLALLVLAYLGQDAAHYLTGEATFQSSYSGPGTLSSVTNATTWVNNFSEHTFFLLPLTVDAAVPLLPSPIRSWFEGGLSTPAWLFSIQQHIWILTFLAVWVGGCYAVDSDSGPFPFMFVKRRMLKCKLDTESLLKDLATIRKWTTDQKPSREKTSHWWFSDLTDKESKAFDRIANCKKVRSGSLLS